ncbi:dienelactone hydrolase family protein [[Bacillus] enclensis]|uniref:dienelactone hydrolase family protein n=1 Tax=[Bacillus] enclensis TaxID=1402860 RepID=UPI0005094690|nr:dienelactone hydrolase family protein [[Bacillus] enclensis]MBH9966089.1 dienelactone hydrolase family protein [[Bacillus] enclensis]
MLSCRKSDTLVVIVHEIHGVNKHMRYMANLIDHLGMDVICPNLYPPGMPLGESEEEVYKSFFKYVGFERAAAQIKGTVEENRRKYKYIFVVGFSVGATSAWLCSDHEGVSGVLCFYGSRIRDYVEVKPASPALLFFSNKEKFFDVHPLITQLEKKGSEYIDIHLFDANHGFANPYSKAFCQEAFDESFSILKEVITTPAEAVEQ